MKKIKIFLALVGATLLSANALAETEAPSLVNYDVNGDGTVAEGEQAYELKSADDLYWFANYANQGGDNAKANAVLANDITVNENLLSSLIKNEDGNVTNGGDFKAWNLIGLATFPFDKYYAGTFDGNGHTISGLYFNNPNSYGVGLFGLATGATIKNVGVVDSYFKGYEMVGGVCGYISGTITNCYNISDVNGYSSVGGVCGYISGTIENCYNAGKVSGDSNVGGVCGKNNGTITNCYNTVDVNGKETVGGVCGYNDKGHIANCYNTGEVKGSVENGYVGGVCGENYYGTITNCYNTGKVNGSVGNGYVGGVSGYNDNGTIANCYNIGEVSGSVGNGYVGGVCGINSGSIANCYNIGAVSGDDERTNIGGMCGYNSEGTIINCYYLDSTAIKGIGKGMGWPAKKNADNFANGTVAVLLQASQTDEIWGQKLINGKSMPVLASFETECCKVKDGEVECAEFESGFCVICGGYQQPPQDVNGVYQIANAGHLYWFAKYVNQGGDNAQANAVLTSDIVVNENLLSSLEKDEDGNVTNGDDFKVWAPIGDYAGTFDGNGHTVSGLFFYDSKGKCVGLFGTTAGGATIKKVGVIDSYFKGYVMVGGVCGYNQRSTIINCYNAGEVSGCDGSYHIGGVCGCNDKGTITNCYNAGEASGCDGSSEIGVVCGYNADGIITNCYYLASEESTDGGRTATQFADGTVAQALRNYDKDKEEQQKIGSNIWGQFIGVDKSPTFTGNSVLTQITAENREEYNLSEDYIGYYAIGNADDLYWFSGLVNGKLVNIAQNKSANAVLTSDIVVNENVLDNDGNLNQGTFREWTLIGYYNNDDDKVDYAGTFDGNGHTISGLYFNNSSRKNVGLFGRITTEATIKNVGVIDSYFRGKESVGGVCGENNNGAITNCYNAGEVSGDDGSSEIGGVCGFNFGGAITNCYNAGKVSGDDSCIGGLCGYNNGGKITKCYNVGEISDGYQYVGGVCGYNNGTIENCYNAGEVNCEYSVGGVCGYNGDGTITNCYNTSKVNGDKGVGGVCGSNVKGTIENCYNTGEVNANQGVGGVCGNNGEGTIKNCYYLNSGSEGIGRGDGEATAQSAKQFASGEVAYKLGGAFYQKIGVDASPVLDSTHGKVYLASPCIAYSNTENAVAEHKFDGNGFCKRCGSYQPAENNGGVYQIANAGNLYWFAGLVNGKLIGVGQNKSANAVLTSDIVVNENVLDNDGNLSQGTFREWFPIGYDNGKLYVNYGGTFDGRGHTISGLCLNDPNTVLDGIGLFGNIYKSAIIKTVGIIDSYFYGKCDVGGVCGYSEGTIENCYYTGKVSGDSLIGGVCGMNSGFITNCYNTGDASGITRIGGFCGSNAGGTITNCYNTGSVNGSGTSRIGGFCGESTNPITNCYFLSGTDANATQATAKQFKSGEVAYRLGGAFYQKIGADASPVLDSTHGKVYLASPCIAYSNTENATIEHKFDINGYCTVCGAYEPASEDENEVYQIANVGNLYWFMEYVNNNAVYNEDADAYLAKVNAVLVNDITVNKNLLDSLKFDEYGNVANGDDFKAWNPIGHFNGDYDAFVNYTGTFDGRGHTISGLYLNDPSIDCVSLFGEINGATIKNVGVTDSYFEGYYYVGGVCGNNHKGHIVNCYNTGVVSGSYDVGGVCGSNSGTIENCYNTGVVSVSSDFIGGVCGYNDEGGTITNCYFLSGTDVNAIQKTAKQFADGTVAKLLFASDSIWGQNTSTDTVPNFSGKIIFTVSVTASDNGTVSGTSGEYEYNSKLAIVATPNTGYHFAEWSNGSTKIKDTILVVSDTALVATFEAHSFGNWDTTLVATCTVGGSRTHTCACGAFETEKIDALGHTFVVDSAVSATCSATGLTAGLHCSACDSVFLAQQIVAKIAHTVVVDSAKTATCTVAGLTEGKHCSVCDSVLVAQQTIPALGHSFTNYIYNNDATTEADGTETAVCDHGCGATDTRTAEGTKLTDIDATEASEVFIYAHHNVIVVENAEADIYVYDATGRCIEMRESCPSVEIALPREGIYIVRAGDKVQRVAVV